MFVIIGAVVVLVCVFGAYSVHGNLLILIQPLEFVIILGAAVGAFIIGNTKTNIRQTLKGVGRAMKGPRYKKASNAPSSLIQVTLPTPPRLSTASGFGKPCARAR